MRYQVPQFVDIEDKVIGPLTVKQFLIYMVAAMLLLPVYLLSDMPLFITIAIPVGGIAVMFAHFKLNGKSLFSMLGYALQFAFRGQIYIWRRTANDKPLPVIGEEYEMYDLKQEDLMSSLSERARALQTSGRIVNEDTDDELDFDSAGK
jgi:hypothetical protein